MKLVALGRLELQGSRFARLKSLLILAYLAVEGPTSRRVLAELFFPDAKDPRDSLSTALRYLRRADPGLVVRDGDHVSTSAQCDATDALKLMDDGADRAAVDLYGGAFLKGLDLTLGPELEDWVFGTREAIASRTRTALIRLAEDRVGAGDHEEAARYAERAYLLSGAPEPDPDTLIRLHVVLLAVGHRLEDEIWREATAFGVALERSRSKALERLSPTNDGDRPDIVPHNIASRSSMFVGRDPELTEIATLIEDAEVRLVTLQGAGGTGKSLLAMEVARSLLGQEVFPDGVFFVKLEAVFDPRHISSAIAEALSISLQGAEMPIEQVKRHIGSKTILLVLDNYEHLVDAADVTRALLDACPHLTLLVTSRERLNTKAEWLVPVEGLAFPRPDVAASDARRYDAVRLFVLRAKHHNRSYELLDSDLPHVIRICAAVEGSPLGLELAATWVHHMRVEAIADEIERGMDVLESNIRDLPRRHQSMRATFDRSWSLLNDQERSALRKLSVFRGGFRRAAASAVAGVTLATLGRLVDKSMLRASPTGRYDRHPLLLQYMLEHLGRDESERSEMVTNHGEYFMSFFVANAGESFGGEEEVGRAMRALEEEIPNVRAAWLWAVGARRFDHLVDGMIGLTHFAEITSAQAEVLILIRHAIDELSEDGDESSYVVANLVATLPVLLYRIGAMDNGLKHAKSGIALLESHQLRERNAGLWIAHYGHGLASLMLGSYRPDHFQRAADVALADIERARAADAPEVAVRQTEVLLGITRCGAAMALTACGDFDGAQRQLDEARSRLEALRSPYFSFMCWIQCDVSLAVGRIEEALAWGRRGLEFAKAHRYATEVTSLEHTLARIAFLTGDIDTAASYCRRVGKASAASGDHYIGTHLATLEGWMALQEGSPQRALDSFRLAIERARVIKANAFMMEPLLGLADTFASVGRQQEAFAILGFLGSTPMAPAIVADRARTTIERSRSSGAHGIQEHVERGSGLDLDGALTIAIAHGEVRPSPREAPADRGSTR